MRIEWHPLARADLADLISYIAADNGAAAVRLHDTINRQIGLLGSHPEIGRSGRVSGTRELVMPRSPYVAAYRVNDGLVTNLRVLHGARRWPSEL